MDGIATDDDEIIFGRCRGDEEVELAEIVSPSPAIFQLQAPPQGEVLTDRQGSTVEKRMKRMIEPSDDRSTALGIIELFDTKADLREGDVRDKQILLGLRRDEPYDGSMRSQPAQFRYDVSIEQESAQRSTALTGLVTNGRSKSTSLSGEPASASTRCLPLWCARSRSQVSADTITTASRP